MGPCAGHSRALQPHGRQSLLGRARFRRGVGLTCLIGSLVTGMWPAQTADAPATGIDFFERKIRPLFADHCFSCHGEEKQKGHLRLDSPTALRAGGESGALFVPGQPAISRLIQAVGYQDPDLMMPPKQRLSERQIADLTEWIQRGAPLPEGGTATAASRPRKEFQITEADRTHWAFQPLQRPLVSSGSHPIDTLVDATLQAQGLQRNPEATPRELVRRVYFDLLGLPPAPEAVAAYEQDPAPDRYERLIDRLLTLPQYGERWGRHWLDVVRFAQSNGYERDGEKHLAWRYRDYVIKAFNEDKPYDRFVQEQIAGDELPDATADSVAATGFQRLGVFDDEPDDKVAAEFDALDDVLSTTGAAFLGLTLGCARCHDHKFDPLPQADYYSLLAFFRGVRPFESTRSSFDSPGFAPYAAPRDVQQWLTTRNARLKPLEEQLATTQDATTRKQLEKEIQQAKEAPFEWTLAVREAGPNPPATHILVRGNAATPGAKVEPAFPRILNAGNPRLPAPGTHAHSSGRRLALAEWIASPQNPLTARVIVNRIWHHHFGRGLVKTTTDFGRAGAPPSHPQLLDWLATEFIEGGWSMKRLHRLILLSGTYRQSSRTDNERAQAADPSNQWLWRQNLRRLEAESLRDAVLSIAGTLNLKMGGRGYFPHLGGEVLAGQSRPGLDWDVSSNAEQSRRSVYAYVRRTMAIPLLENFDYNNNTSPLGERSITTVAPQALMLLNDDFLLQQAAALARRVAGEVGEPSSAQIRQAFRLALSRDPTPRERQITADLLQRQTAAFSTLATRLHFRPDVASALSADYFAHLQAGQFLLGPRTGWTYHRGFWAPPYEGIRVVDLPRAPFALWSGAAFTNGVITTRMQLSGSTEFASLLLRARANGDLSHGYEVRFDARQQQITLRRHDREVVTVATEKARIPSGRPLEVKIQALGPQFQIWLDHETVPVLSAVDGNTLPEAGAIGVRIWGGGVSLDALTVQPTDTGRGDSVLVPTDGASATQRALQAVCLLIFNLNETVYID